MLQNPKKDFPVLFSDYFLYNPLTKHKYSDKFGIYMLQLNQLGKPEDERIRLLEYQLAETEKKF